MEGTNIVAGIVGTILALYGAIMYSAIVLGARADEARAKEVKRNGNEKNRNLFDDDLYHRCGRVLDFACVDGRSKIPPDLDRAQSGIARIYRMSDYKLKDIRPIEERLKKLGVKPTFGRFYFSKKQRRELDDKGRDKMFCKIDGVVKEYTEMVEKHQVDIATRVGMVYEPIFEDAVCLGDGYYYGRESTKG